MAGILDVVYRFCVPVGLVTIPLGWAFRFRDRYHWLTLITLVSLLEAVLFWFDAGEISIEIFVMSLATAILVTVVYKRRERPSVTFLVLSLLICGLLTEMMIGPKVRAAKKLGRGQIPAPRLLQKDDRRE